MMRYVNCSLGRNKRTGEMNDVEKKNQDQGRRNCSHVCALFFRMHRRAICSPGLPQESSGSRLAASRVTSAEEKRQITLSYETTNEVVWAGNAAFVTGKNRSYEFKFLAHQISEAYKANPQVDPVQGRYSAPWRWHKV